nr:GrpB family protein [Alteribacter populi]
MKEYWKSEKKVKRPVIVVDYNSSWKEDFQKEAEKLTAVFGRQFMNIHHIGSTSVEGLAAKPIIDILIEVRDLNGVDVFNQSMKQLGYVARGENGIPGRRYFYKGEGKSRSHHIHVFQEGSEQVERHLAFRDYLREHRKESLRYAELKKNLSRRFPTDIESYLKGKVRFVEELERKAVYWKNQG